MVSQITIMCMKSGQGETLRYESWACLRRAEQKKGSEDQGFTMNFDFFTNQ